MTTIINNETGEPEIVYSNSRINQLPISSDGLSLLNSRPSKVSMIAAVDVEGGYAKNGQIPWHYKDDMKWFRHITDESICVMGRTTYDDICDRLGDKAADRLLPNRDSYVLTSRPLQRNNATPINSIGKVLELMHNGDSRSIFIIGGISVWEEAFSYVDTVYLTIINKKFECDSHLFIDRIQAAFKHTRTFKTDDPDLRFTMWEREPIRIKR